MTRAIRNLLVATAVVILGCGGGGGGGKGSDDGGSSDGGAGNQTSASCLSLQTMNWALRPTQPFGESTLFRDLNTDGSSVYFSTDRYVGVVPASGGTATQLYDAGSLTVHTHFFLDGSRLLISADGAPMVSVPTAGGTATKLPNFNYTLESTLGGEFGAKLVSGVLYGKAVDTSASPTTYTYFSYPLSTSTASVIATTTLTAYSRFAVAGDTLVTKDTQGTTVTLYNVNVAGGSLQPFSLSPAADPTLHIVGAVDKALYVLSVPDDLLSSKPRLLRVNAQTGTWDTALTLPTVYFPGQLLVASANGASYLSAITTIYSLPAAGTGKQVACFDYNGYTTHAFAVDAQYAYVGIYVEADQTNGIARVKLQ